VLVSEEVEHQRTRPDLADRIRNALARDVGRGAMNRLEQRRILALRIEVRRRGNADRAAHRGAEIRQDVAEEVRADDDVEAFGTLDEMRAQDVDVELVGADVRIR